MALSVNTNTSALTIANSLTKTSKAAETSQMRLSTALRINSAQDDAAGLSIATKMTSEIRSLDQSLRNANDSISLSQVAESGISNIQENLDSLHELSLQAANSTLSSDDRDAINLQAQSLISNISQTASSTSFNGVNLLDGTYQNQSFQIGSQSSASVSLSLPNMSANSLGSGSGNVASIDLSSISGAQAAVSIVDNALSDTSSSRANVGALQSRVTTAMASSQSMSDNLRSARSQLSDADFAAESAKFAQATLLKKSAISLMTQANASSRSAIGLL